MTYEILTGGLVEFGAIGSPFLKLCTMSGKRWHYISASNFARCWRSSRFFHRQTYSSELAEKWQVNISPHLKCVSTLPVRYLCSKIAVVRNWMKQNVMQDSAIWSSYCQKYSWECSNVSIIWFPDEWRQQKLHIMSRVTGSPYNGCLSLDIWMYLLFHRDPLNVHLCMLNVPSTPRLMVYLENCWI